MNKIRTRFAPSPTGFLHVGGLRSALYDYLFTRKNNGTFILKIEDTDQKRYVKGAVEDLIRSLEWAGLRWHEGVFISAVINESKATVVPSPRYPNILEVGDYGPYIQSEKLDVYKKYAEQLIKDGHAYYCFCTPIRLEDLRKTQSANKQAPMYDQHCLNLSESEIKTNIELGVPYVVRMKIPKNETIEIDDIIRGKVKFNTNLVDDQVILKSDGYPTYHLASIVDDHTMKMSHVVRGEEWLPSVPKHILLYKYFGWEPPKFAHLPLLVNPDRTKLSKRQGDVAVEDYIQKGYLKEAIINFVALLGWNPGHGDTQEIFSMEELIEKFDLEKVHKAGAVFDLKKLDWINSQYIKKLSIDDLYNLTLDFFKQKTFFQNASNEKRSEDYIKKVLTIEQERLVSLSEVGESNKFFFRDLFYDKEVLRWKEMGDEDLKNSLMQSKKVLENIPEFNWTKENLEKSLLEAAADKRGELLWPLRVSLTGEKKSPTPFEVAWVLGKSETLKRISQAMGII
jgi:glutamyl-tRNA synthetase